MSTRVALPVLYERVHARASELQAARPGWPCTRGCDGGCRRLARVPELSRAEWEPIQGALQALPLATRALIMARAQRLAQDVQRRGEDGPWVCPFLDEQQGACHVYAQRPLGCRTYGFYVGRHHDAWCDLVAEHVAATRAQLVCGNLDAIERELSALDPEQRGLLTWLLGEGEA